MTTQQVKEKLLEDIKMELIAHKLGSIEVSFFEGLISLKLDQLESALKEEFWRRIASLETDIENYKITINSLTHSPAEIQRPAQASSTTSDTYPSGEVSKDIIPEPQVQECKHSYVLGQRDICIKCGSFKPEGDLK